MICDLRRVYVYPMLPALLVLHCLLGGYVNVGLAPEGARCLELTISAQIHRFIGLQVNFKGDAVEGNVTHWCSWYNSFSVEPVKLNANQGTSRTLSRLATVLLAFPRSSATAHWRTASYVYCSDD